MTPPIEYRDLTATERKLLTPLFDTLTAHVTECSGYTLLAASGVLVCAEFKYPGGSVPLALDPTKPAPHNVRILRGAIRLSQMVASVPVLRPLPVAAE